MARGGFTIEETGATTKKNQKKPKWIKQFGCHFVAFLVPFCGLLVRKFKASQTENRLEAVT